MKAADDRETGAKRLAEAAIRTCTFDFAAAEDLCRRMLALQDPAVTAQAQALLKAIEHNRSSFLYNLVLQRSTSAVADTGSAGRPTGAGPGALRLVCRQVLERAWNGLRYGFQSGETTFAGTFDVDFGNTGMVVSGSVHDGSEMLHVFINELLVASVKSVPDEGCEGEARSFRFRIGTPSLSLLPGSTKARLAISTGNRMLRGASGSAFHLCDWPEGKGGIEDAILNGAMLTAHHHIKPPPPPETIERWLNAYERLAAFMREKSGKPLFLYYGTLLGAVRENSVIPFDDDFDVAYFSDKTTPREVRDEMVEIVAALAASDPGVTIVLRNFFFKIVGRRTVIDVFPAWHDGCILWSPWSTRLECEPDLLKPLVDMEFHGRRVQVPLHAESFLALKYGEGWRTPDPDYRVQALPRDAYPFRQFVMDEDDRIRILEAARRIAGDAPIAKVKFPDA